MRELVLIPFVLGCQAVDIATCDDPACVIGSLTPEQVRGALEYAGPCYQYADRFCDRIEFCTGALTSSNACRGWVLETVCAEPVFDPDELGLCSQWADQVACDWFWDPEFYPQRQSCADHVPRPIPADLWEDPVPPALVSPAP